MKNNLNKTLEETIRELHKKYKNTPSPLSEQYQKQKPPIVPQQNGAGPRNILLGDFKPTPKQW